MVSSGPGRPAQLKKAERGGLTVANAYLNLEVMHGVSRALKDRSIPCKQARGGVAEHLALFIRSVEAFKDQGASPSLEAEGGDDEPDQTANDDSPKDETQEPKSDQEPKEGSTLDGGEHRPADNVPTHAPPTPDPGSVGGGTPALIVI